MKFTATLCALLFSTLLFAQNGYEIKVTLKPFKNQYIYLGHYYGKQLPIIDSVKLNEKSEGIFRGTKKLGGGIYLVGYPDRSHNFEILVDKVQRFSVAADTANDPVRDDVEAVCARLAERVGANTGRRPNVTQAWRTDARLLLDRDLAQEPDRLALVLAVLDWATDDPFWRSNILSIPKFRKQFDQLRLKRREEADRRRTVSTGRGRPTTDDKRAEIRRLAAERFGSAYTDPTQNGSPVLRALPGGTP